ncbi:non-ribosomal peptide synthetase [Acuticoccus sp. M5D2P5]|uniref:non-ribosomal peptide synthetase n=1 Tax=Acuticoccus kalidii TaxID=2910977 RepID=UPI001F20A59A|nr:non-ribosomal peptide synthetase [Acuticoccus kalidii]MCF3935174.1 non-ribosomal peptide synthetase [Acuticoccus kalidii]
MPQDDDRPASGRGRVTPPRHRHAKPAERERFGYDPRFTVLQCFEPWVRATPDAVAILTKSRQVTYKALSDRAEAIAERLLAENVAPGDLVAIAVGRSVDAVAAMIAVLRCGATYVPLDPAYPAHQLRSIASDCKPKVGLMAEGSTSLSEAIDPAVTTLIPLEAIPSKPIGAPTAPPAINAMSAAYVMYTSGSTGRPKGVLVPHRGIVRLVREQTYVDFGPEQVMLHTAPLAFDVSTFEIWGGLLNGGRVAIVEDAQPSLDEIANAVTHFKVTFATLTAALFHLIVDHRLDAFANLRQLVVGGDVMSPRHARRAVEALPGCRLVNAYGPTENTTITCTFEVSRSGWADGPVPIGTPIAHDEVVILDDRLRPLPQGTVGQLAVMGDGLALGYFDRPAETGAKFITFERNGKRERAYLTGDLAWQRADGVLEFCGRADRQVKIAGRRIELGEVEEAIRKDPEVAEVCVLAEVDKEYSKELVAFVRRLDAGGTTSDEAFISGLATRLLQKLPAFMVPSRFDIIDEFPLNTVGKIDHAKLSERYRTAREDSYAPGASGGFQSNGLDTIEGLERAIARVWRSVVNCSDIRPDQSFFDIGGRSIQLIEAHVLLEHVIGRPFDIVLMFKHPRLHDLAEALLENLRQGSIRHAGHTGDADGSGDGSARRLGDVRRRR